MGGSMRRRKRKKNKIILISFISLLFLLSVGYSSFSSDFLINGKGTIKEKITAYNYLKKNIVNSGDGLYADEYEEGRYIYKGSYSNLNNFIDIDGDLYRIVSLESDKTIKVVKNESLSILRPYDSAGNRNDPSSDGFCNVDSGCKSWAGRGTVTRVNGDPSYMPHVIGGTEYYLEMNISSLNEYLNNTLYFQFSNEIQKMIVEHDFNVGLVNLEETDFRQTLLTESEYKWSGKIGLLNVSDYVNGSSNSLCTSVYSYTYAGGGNCSPQNSSHNYLAQLFERNSADIDRMVFLLNPSSYTRADRSISVFIADSNDLISYQSSTIGNIFPAFYLSQDIYLEGSGSVKDPFMPR